MIDNTTDLILSIPEETLQKCWSKSFYFTNSAAARWSVYLNLISLYTLVPWLQEQEEVQQVVVEREFYQSNFGGFALAGFSISVSNQHWVLVPSEAIDCSELRVWGYWLNYQPAVDYFVAVQVDVEVGLIRVWGYVDAKKFREFATIERQFFSLSDTYLHSSIDLLILALSYGESIKAVR